MSNRCNTTDESGKKRQTSTGKTTQSDLSITDRSRGDTISLLRQDDEFRENRSVTAGQATPKPLAKLALRRKDPAVLRPSTTRKMSPTHCGSPTAFAPRCLRRTTPSRGSTSWGVRPHFVLIPFFLLKLLSFHGSATMLTTVRPPAPPRADNPHTIRRRCYRSCLSPHAPGRVLQNIQAAPLR